MWRCFLVAGGGVLPDRWPADTPTPRGEGAGLSAPAAAAKEEQLAQHCESPYQLGAPGGTRVHRRGGGGGILGGVTGPGRVGCEDAYRASRPDRHREDPRVFRGPPAAQRVDEPEGPWFTERPFGGWLTVGWSGDPREVWLAADQGSAAGWYRLGLPSRENLDQAGLDLVVHPAERRRGLGLALLRHAAGRAAAQGRAVLNGGARRGSPARRSPARSGPNRGWWRSSACSTSAAGEGKLARLRGPAELAAAGYSLESWAGPIPEDFLEQVAMLYNAMGDAPRDPRSPMRNGTPSGSARASTTCARTTGCATTRWWRDTTTPASWRR